MLLPETPPQVQITGPKITDVMLAAFAAFGYALSARLLLLIALIGAFALAVMAMMAKVILAAVILALYCCLTVIPLVVLERDARK
jgi:hypothetical protein